MLALQRWDQKWAELAPEHAHPGVVLWSWATGYLRKERLPKGRVLIRFDYPTYSRTGSRAGGWLLSVGEDWIGVPALAKELASRCAWCTGCSTAAGCRPTRSAG